MTKPTIIGTGPLFAPLIEILEPFGEIIITPDQTQESLLPLLDDAIGVVLRGDGTFTEQALNAAGNLKVIGRTGVGYDKVCVAAATKRGIPVVFTPGAGARAVVNELCSGINKSKLAIGTAALTTTTRTWKTRR